MAPRSTWWAWTWCPTRQAPAPGRDAGGGSRPLHATSPHTIHRPPPTAANLPPPSPAVPTGVHALPHLALRAPHQRASQPIRFAAGGAAAMAAGAAHRPHVTLPPTSDAPHLSLFLPSPLCLPNSPLHSTPIDHCFAKPFAPPSATFFAACPLVSRTDGSERQWGAAGSSPVADPGVNLQRICWVRWVGKAEATERRGGEAACG